MDSNTELDMLVVRRQQMWRVRDCKIIACEHVAAQHKPLVFVVRMQKTREMAKDHQMVEMQSGHSRCIQRLVDIRLRETGNNSRNRRMEGFQRCFC